MLCFILSNFSIFNEHLLILLVTVVPLFMEPNKEVVISKDRLHNSKSNMF